MGERGRGWGVVCEMGLLGSPGFGCYSMTYFAESQVYYFLKSHFLLDLSVANPRFYITNPRKTKPNAGAARTDPL